MKDDATEACRLIEELLHDGVSAGSAPLSVGDTLIAASVIGAFVLGRRPQVVRKGSRDDPLWLACAMGTGLRALREWPNQFHMFLSILQSRRDQHSGLYSIVKELGPFAKWLNGHRQTEFGRVLGEGVNNWLAAQHRVATRSESVLQRRRKDTRKLYLTTTEAAARLGVKKGMLQCFVVRSGFGGAPIQGTGSLRMLPARDVEGLLALQSGFVGIDKISSVLGVTVNVARSFARAGLVKRFSTIEILDPSRPFILTDAQRLLEVLESKVVRQSRGLGQYSAHEAGRTMRGGIVALVQGTLDGTLVPVAVDETASGIDRVRYDYVDRPYLNVVEEGMIALRDIPKRVGLSQTIVTQMVSAGFFEGINPDGRRRQGSRKVSLSAVIYFEQKYILVQEIARRMGMPWQRLVKRLPALSLTPISGPQVDGCIGLVFDRRETEAVIANYMARRSSANSC